MSTNVTTDYKEAPPASSSTNSLSEKIDVKESPVDDQEHALDPRFAAKSGPRSLFVDGIKINVDPNVPALADGDTESKWSWLDLFRPRKPVADWNAIATRPSVYDDPVLAPHYAPRSVSLAVGLDVLDICAIWRL